MKMVKYSIIIPTLNEEEGIAKVICGIPNNIARNSEIIVVDSGNDLTNIIAKKLGVKVIIAQKKGKGYQMKLGAEAAKSNILIFIDGDGEHPPEYIPKLLKKLNSCDIVLGSKCLSRKGSKIHKSIYALFSILTVPLFRQAGLKLRGDPLTGFRVMHKKTWRALNLKSNNFLIETEMNIKAVKRSLKIGEIIIPVEKRAGGLLKSKFLHSPDQWVKIVKYVLKNSIRKKINLKKFLNKHLK